MVCRILFVLNFIGFFDPYTIFWLKNQNGQPWTMLWQTWSIGFGQSSFGSNYDVNKIAVGGCNSYHFNKKLKEFDILANKLDS